MVLQITRFIYCFAFPSLPILPEYSHSINEPLDPFTFLGGC